MGCRVTWGALRLTLECGARRSAVPAPKSSTPSWTRRTADQWRVRRGKHRPHTVFLTWRRGYGLDWDAPPSARLSRDPGATCPSVVQAVGFFRGRTGLEGGLASPLTGTCEYTVRSRGAGIRQTPSPPSPGSAVAQQPQESRERRPGSDPHTLPRGPYPFRLGERRVRSGPATPAQRLRTGLLPGCSGTLKRSV